MKIVNLNLLEGVLTMLYPDGEPQVNIPNLKQGDEVGVICSITDSVEFVQLLKAANAIKAAFAKKKVLYIPYLMGARGDRLMQEGDAISLQMFADAINALEFEKVILFDVHSDVALMAIKNSINISNKLLVQKYNVENSILICPDAGAAKKIKSYLEWNWNFKDVVYCVKHRDVSNGQLTIRVPEPEKFTGRNCVIIDDLCDGGGTFLGIAQQLIEPMSLHLIVSHGVFSKGFTELEKYFNSILTTNSYKLNYDSGVVTVCDIQNQILFH